MTGDELLIGAFSSHNLLTPNHLHSLGVKVFSHSDETSFFSVLSEIWRGQRQGHGLCLALSLSSASHPSAGHLDTLCFIVICM